LTPLVQNRERVLRAATAAFLRDGYRASVERIAQRAGVAKQTVYSHFPSKDELFKEVARELTKTVLVQLESSPQDLRAALLAFALAYRSRVLCPKGIAMFRTLMAEIPRFGGLARAIYEGGAGETVRGLAAHLKKAMDEGRLRRDDPQFAAELLLGMLAGMDRNKMLYGVARFSQGSDARRAGRIVDGFLRMYSIEGRS
jgi:TetR/AcrR family transcriptional repressor of mexJK operon